MRIKKIGTILLAAARAWSEDNAQRLGAALAFYGIFSVAPLLIVVFAVIGQFYNNIDAKNYVLNQITFWMSDAGKVFFEQLLAEVAKPGANYLAFALGSGGILIGAVSVIGELRDAFEKIWGMPSKKWSTGIMLEKMAVAVLLLFLLAVSFLVSLIMTTVLSSWGASTGQWLAIPVVWLHFLDSGISIVVMTIFLTLFFKAFSPVSVRFSSALWGALTTALCFLIGKQALTFYLQFTTVGALYGAASALMIVLIWMYYAMQILLYGLEVVKLHHKSGGHSSM